MPTRPRRFIRPVSPVEAYITAVHRELIRLIVRLHGANAPQDVAQNVVESLLGKVHDVMSQYPNPVTYARVSFRHGVIQGDRRDRIQRGQGSRLRSERDGSLAPGRTVVSGDAPGLTDDRCLFDTLVHDVEALDDMVATCIDNSRQLQTLLEHLSTPDRSALFLARGLGHPVTEVAGQFGVRRETMQRRIGRIEQGLAVS